MLTILGVSVLSSNTLSSVSEYGNHSQENGIVNKWLLKLANNSQKDKLSSMSYIDNYIPQEWNEVEFDEEILLDNNDTIYDLYASTNEYNNKHKDDHPSGATKIRFIIVTNLVKNSNNRGRMVISDIDYRYGF